jgi:hypothetical protein
MRAFFSINYKLIPLKKDESYSMPLEFPVIANTLGIYGSLYSCNSITKSYYFILFN